MIRKSATSMLSVNNVPTVRRLRESDAPWVARLYAQNSRENLTSAERQSSGFVQGALSENDISKRVVGPASLVAMLGSDPVGVMLTAMPTRSLTGPPRLALNLALKEGITDAFLYGPVLISQEERGRGLLRLLTQELVLRTRGDFRFAVGFIDEENRVSQLAHEALGWVTGDSFDWRGHSFHLISLPLS